MSVTDSQRRQLFTDLERAVGAESAAAMMELLPPVGWADVARQSAMDAQFVAVRGEMAELRSEVRLQGRSLAAINAVAVIASSMTTAGLVLAAARFA